MYMYTLERITMEHSAYMPMMGIKKIKWTRYSRTARVNELARVGQKKTTVYQRTERISLLFDVRENNFTRILCFI